MQYTTLKDALKRIEELENEVSSLKEELETYKNLKPAGRKKHGDSWQATYSIFVDLYEAGTPIPLIVEKSGCSRRTVYRYKEYYDKLSKENNGK